MRAKAGFVIKKKPRAYPETEQHRIFKDALRTCGIEKGMSKADLQKQMKECIPDYYRRLKEHAGEKAED